MKQQKTSISLVPFDKREELIDFWYTEVSYNGGMVEFHPIDGCHVILDPAMQIWDIIKGFFDREMQHLKVKKCHFPFIVESDPYETDILVQKSVFPYYSKWIRSPSDLPMKFNQWLNSATPELSNPKPFLRSRDCLRQIGHSAFATKKEAYKDVFSLMAVYCRMFEDLLAIPFHLAQKTEGEKQNSGLFSITLEVFIPETGHAVQGASVDCLGQEFAKAFHIFYEKESGEETVVWQNSWSFSSAVIGLMILIHGDDKGLVIPPNVAPIQVLVIPACTFGIIGRRISEACKAVAAELGLAGIRADLDNLGDLPLNIRQDHWKQKGIPLIIQIGETDLANYSVLILRRDDGAAINASRANLANSVVAQLKAVQKNLIKVSKKKRDDSIVQVETWDDFVVAIKQRKLVLAPWSDNSELEREICERTHGVAKTYGSPIDPPLPLGTLCFASGKLAKTWTYWCRLY